MTNQTHISAWQTENLANIHKRLKLVRSSETFEKIIPGKLQGIFIRKVEQTLEMYCYDNESKNLSSIMSRINLDDPLCLLGHYTQVMFLSAFWQQQPPQNVYMAGYGGGRIAMLLRHYFQGIKIDGTDIDPNVLASTQVFFGIDKQDLSGIHLGDSREDLSKRAKSYDIILLDVFAGSGEHVNHLATKEFFELCKDKLSDGGTLVANLIEADPMMHEKIAAIKTQFKHLNVWKQNGAYVVFASNKEIDLKAIMERVEGFTEQETLNFTTSEHIAVLEAYKAPTDTKALSDTSL